MNINFNLGQRYRYPSRRSVVFGNCGMVATASQLAAGAGMDMLKAGGNAVDAAIATAICLTVVEPVSNGIGSDAFAIVWMKDHLYGLNSSGFAPGAISADIVRGMGHTEMPIRGWLPVTVPGAPAAWRELSRRFGRLPFRKLFEPAIGYARYGYAISPFVAHEWEQERKALSVYAEDPAFSGWFDTFLNAGRAPRPGEIVRLKDHADTLEEIAESETAALYAGRIAHIIDAFARETGGYLRKEDLSAWNPEWVDPVSINYRGYDVWELPPNGHGIVPLMALNILKGYDFTERDTVETLHRQFEAMKLAYADGKKYITEPSCMTRTVEELLSRPLMPKKEDPSSEKRQGNRSRLSEMRRHRLPFHGRRRRKYGFLYPDELQLLWKRHRHPGTGIALQDRGANFSLDENHNNRLAPRKRTYHTIIPGFLTKEGRAVGPLASWEASCSSRAICKSSQIHSTSA